MEYNKLKVNDVFVKENLIIATQIQINIERSKLQSLTELFDKINGQTIQFLNKKHEVIQIIGVNGYMSEIKENICNVFIKTNVNETFGVSINDLFDIIE